MATADDWAVPKVVREQIVLFAPSLDSMISDDHEVRLLDETLRRLDWSEWEAEYPRLRGLRQFRRRGLKKWNKNGAGRASA